MTGRYVRLHRGQIICTRHDLHGVVAHLHDLARHLEGLIPDEDFLDKLTRAREFSTGFAQRAEYERELEGAVLEALATRPSSAKYEALHLEGYAVEQVESAVFRLWKRGLVDAHVLKPKQVTPSALTTKGFQALEKREQALATKGGA